MEVYLTEKERQIFEKPLMNEKAPPDEEIKNWLEDPEVQKSFKEQYGEDYKEVMFSLAWKKFKKKQQEG